MQTERDILLAWKDRVAVRDAHLVQQAPKGPTDRAMGLVGAPLCTGSGNKRRQLWDGQQALHGCRRKACIAKMFQPDKTPLQLDTLSRSQACC